LENDLLNTQQSTDEPIEVSWKHNLNTFISITTVFLAVCATWTSFKESGYSTRMVLMQSQASDQWAYYQAKGIKETTLQGQRDMIELTMSQTINADLYHKTLVQYDNEVAKYRQDKNDITVEAKRLESERDIAQNYSNHLGQALMFMQMGILLSSLAAINQVAYYWYLGLGAGGIGIIMFIYTMFSI
jgi:hypothetical protein